MPVAHIGPEFVSGSAVLSAASLAKRQGLCAEAWRDINIDAARTDPSYGGFYLNRGEGSGAYTATLTGSGTVNYIAGPSGFGSLLEIDAVSSTDGEGVNLQYKGQGCYPTAGTTIYGSLMCRFKDIGTAPEFLFGHASINIAVIATDVVAAADWAGFLSLSGGTIVWASDDGTQDTGATTLHTMVDGANTTDGTEWVNFDYRWKVGDSFEVYVDGVAKDVSDVAITAEPDGFVVPTIVFQSSGTVDPVLEVAYSAFGFKY